MKKIYKPEDIPEAEELFLIKDFMGWKVIHPVKHPETGEISYFNLLVGGKRNLMFLILCILIATMVYLGIHELVIDYKHIADNPCNYCQGEPSNNQFDTPELPDNFTFTNGGDNG